MIVKDSMVLIHLAKITLLEKSCDYFKIVIIPKKIYEEVLKGKNKGYEDVIIIENMVKSEKIIVKEIKDQDFIKKANNLNIKEGEAEAVALYWQEKANYLATDDDNVRKKFNILDINIIGTPSIIVSLFKEKLITKEKFLESTKKLKSLGWFNNTVIDKMMMEL